MTDKAVPAVRTHVSIAGYARAVVRAWHLVAGGLPPKEAIAILWAQYMIETGNRDAWGWNIGNTKDVRNDGIDYQMLKGVWEGVAPSEAARLVASGEAVLDETPSHIASVGAGRVAVVFQPPHPATWFSAFTSLDDAMAYHLTFIAKNRYASAWPAVLTGDVTGFATALRAKGYFSATAQAYATGMKPSYDAFMRSTAYEEAIGDMAAPISGPAPAAPAAPVDAPPRDPDTSLFVEVPLGGERWLVAPTYVAPIGIGEAVRLAASLGFDLPSPELVDAIWQAADLRIDGERMTFTAADGNDFTTKTMDAATTHALMADRLTRLIGNRGLGVDFHLLAGAYKDVCVQDGKTGLYGLQRLDGTPIQGRDAKGRIFTGHDPSWRDYSQALRLCRKVG